jgi:hypothetical protein
MGKGQEKQQARETWIKVYKQLGCISKAARKCGIAPLYYAPVGTAI